MILYTTHMITACEKLNITERDLADIPHPTNHMCMAHALAAELSALTYEQVNELLGPFDGELCIDVCEHWRLLRLAPGVCETPGKGLPTIAEQMVTLNHEMELSMARGQEVRVQVQKDREVALAKVEKA